MANLHDKTAEQSQPTGGGMRRVLTDGSESLAELREFMGQLRGKSPQEVLGAVASSSLVRSTLVATAACLVLLVGLSVATYYWKLAFAERAAPTAASKSADQPAAAPAPAQRDQQPATPPAAAEQAAASGDPTLDKLGIGETKQADAEKNPLEDSLDNLLDNAK